MNDQSINQGFKDLMNEDKAQAFGLNMMYGIQGKS